MVLIGIGTVSYQAFGWLKHGYWAPIDIRNLTDPSAAIADSGWLGLDEILRWFGRRSVAAVSFIIGVIVVWGTTIE